MAVSAQQSLGVNRRPLRVGRVRYGLWWVEQITAQARARARETAGVMATVGRELRWAFELGARSTALSIERARPVPWNDRRLTVWLAIVAVLAVVTALVLGGGLARWMMTAANRRLRAAAGTLAGGRSFLPLALTSKVLPHEGGGSGGTPPSTCVVVRPRSRTATRTRNRPW